MLNLVDDNDAAQALEGRHGLREEGATCWILQIEVVARFVWHDLSGESSLPALSRSDQSHYAVSSEGASYVAKQPGPFQHTSILP
jgi:hypothetical protein